MDPLVKPLTTARWKRLIGRVVKFAEAMEARPIDHIEARLANLERRLAALDGDAARDRLLVNARSL